MEREASEGQDQIEPKGESQSMQTKQLWEQDLEKVNIGHASTLGLGTKYEIPYQIPIEILEATDRIELDLDGAAPIFQPSISHCALCTASLGEPMLPQGTSSDCWILTSKYRLRPIAIKTKRCSNERCKAMNNIVPHEIGMLPLYCKNFCQNNYKVCTGDKIHTHTPNMTSLNCLWNTFTHMLFLFF